LLFLQALTLTARLIIGIWVLTHLNQLSLAESIYNEIASVNGWRDTAKLIKDAKAAHAKGD